MIKPVGIIDSGLGGLSVASTLFKSLPNESFIYLADSKNCPYGGKSKKEILSLTKKMVNYLKKRKIKLLVVACNTITVTSINDLRKEFNDIPIVGIVPVVKTAAEKTKNGKIGIFSTVATSKSRYQKELIDKFANGAEVTNIGSSRLVPLIEKGDTEAIEEVLEEELIIFKEKGIDALALGCSHFPLIEKQISKALPNVLILDSSGAVSRQVKRILEGNDMLSTSANSSYNFLTTGNKEFFEKFILQIFGSKLTNKAKIERISLQ